MLENDRMETASTEVTSIWRRNDIEKSTWRTHRYFVDFESRIHVEISTSNRCHNFHVNSPFKIDVISTKFPRGISESDWRQIDEDVSIGVGFAWKLVYILEKAVQDMVLKSYFRQIAIIQVTSFWFFYRYFSNQ